MKTWQVYRQRFLIPTWQALGCCPPRALTTDSQCRTERQKSCGKHGQGGWLRYAWPVVCFIDKRADTTESTIVARLRTWIPSPPLTKRAATRSPISGSIKSASCSSFSSKSSVEPKCSILKMSSDCSMASSSKMNAITPGSVNVCSALVIEVGANYRRATRGRCARVPPRQDFPVRS